MKSSKGDAMYEVMKEYSYYGRKTDGNYAWIYDTSTSNSQNKSTVYNSDYSLIGNCALPFLTRGGDWWGSSFAGVFASYGYYGSSNGNGGFRPVLWA